VRSQQAYFTTFDFTTSQELRGQLYLEDEPRYNIIVSAVG